MDKKLRLDLLVDQMVIVELKAVQTITDVDQAKLLTYLRITELWLGLLINFNVTVLRQGLKRIVNG